MPKEQKTHQSNGSIPEIVINQINEHAAGGFVIFYFNSKTGEPEEIMTFDSPAHRLALQKHIVDWSSALQSLDIDIEKAQIIASLMPDDEDSEENKIN